MERMSKPRQRLQEQFDELAMFPGAKSPSRPSCSRLSHTRVIDLLLLSGVRLRDSCVLKAENPSTVEAAIVLGWTQYVPNSGLCAPVVVSGFVLPRNHLAKFLTIATVFYRNDPWAIGRSPQHDYGTDANQSEHERMKCTTVTPTFTVLHQNQSLGSLVEFEKSSKHKQTATWNHTKQTRCNRCLMTLLQCLTTAFEGWESTRSKTEIATGKRVSVEMCFQGGSYKGRCGGGHRK
ncbi:hypothetical protein SELMODRAFT_409371 [Selaginella moellendorffii]|uniref:Uncharacterized protein n=1 Tax=Selaginella moellendorffii TaxID=88036 RepID=D8RB88_SELML|nr:hypothetical protein SELMODRAFT_409371 [Selaginella moellendorffii]